MDKDRAKLAKLRKTKADAKAKQHQELVKSNQSVKDAIVELHQAINGKAAFNDEQIVEQLKLLASNMTFKDEIAKLETAIVNKAKQPIELKNIEQLIDAANPSTVVDAINSMAVKLEANPTSQKADDFIPYRRVIKVGKRFVFDDDKMNVNVMGGGGGGSSVQIPLLRDTDGGQAIAVVNPDGSNIGGSSSSIPTDPLIEYVVQDEAPNDTGASYYGFAKIDGTYLIMERDKTSVPYTDRYANIGNNATRTTYQLAWTNRATLTYDYIFNLTGV